MDMVEKVGKAIQAALDNPPPEAIKGTDKVSWIDRDYIARAAIAAMAVPTPAMTSAADGYVMYCNENEVLPTAGGVYRAMIDAALTSTFPATPSSE